MSRTSGAAALLAAALMVLPGTTTAQGRGADKDRARPVAARASADAPARGKAERPQDPGRGKAEQAQSPGRAGADRPQQGRGNAERQNPGRGNAERPQNPGRGNAERAQPGQGVGRASGAAADAPGRARGNAGERGRAGSISDARLRSGLDRLDPKVRPFANSSRAHERYIAGAAARGLVRGADRDNVRIESVGDRLRVTNGRNDILLELGDDDARRLGAWDVRRLGDRRPSANAPAFCRSGAGHPVWGREWCLDKGFGLGSQRGYVWGRSTIDDIIWRRTDRDRLDRGGLIDVLGDVVFGRLALHALSLGVTEPVNGVWLSEPDAPLILQVNAGGAPIAEFVDLDRDDEVDVLFIVTPLW